jgi:hypothetical protein
MFLLLIFVLNQTAGASKAAAAAKRVIDAQDTQEVAKVGSSSTFNIPLTDYRVKLDFRHVKGNCR